MARAVRSVTSMFFFSSRRRHTRSLRDWSSDVCSSDLVDDRDVRLAPQPLLDELPPDVTIIDASKLPRGRYMSQDRSEERRVGKECSSRGAPHPLRKKRRSRQRPLAAESWCSIPPRSLT